ncbi:MerR family transcriptional regulator, partial [Streptococcus sp.]
MSQTYTTGDLAKLAGVSVRTVQYYDKRGILLPSQLTEGGRRIYTESDLERLHLICFLRELDFSIEQIKRLFAE